MAAKSLAIVLLYCLVTVTYGEEVLFSKLSKTLQVTASPAGQVLQAGKGQIFVTWKLSQPNVDTSAYKTVSVKLCYSKESQKDRPWRKTVDNLAKDKTCQHDVVSSQPFTATANYTVHRDVPSATYFVRVYVYDDAKKAVGYGQTDDSTAAKMFKVKGISGRHTSLDICSGVFSAFSVVALFWFFYMEKRKAKLSTASSS